MLRLICFSLAVWILPESARSGEATPPPAVLRYAAQIEKMRAAKLVELDAELAAVDSSATAAKDIQKAAIEKKIAKTKTFRAIFRPELPATPGDQHKGLVGELSDRTFTVVKVIDGDEMIVTYIWKPAGGTAPITGTAVIKGPPTHGKLTEKNFSLKGVFEYAGRDDRRDRAPVFVLVNQRDIDEHLRSLRQTSGE